MNDMSDWEACDTIRNLQYIDRIDREMSRYLLYMTAQVNSKKKLTPTDILELPWDKPELPPMEHKTTMSNEERDTLMALAEKELEVMNRKTSAHE